MGGPVPSIGRASEGLSVALFPQMLGHFLLSAGFNLFFPSSLARHRRAPAARANRLDSVPICFGDAGGTGLRRIGATVQGAGDVTRPLLPLLCRLLLLLLFLLILLLL